MAMSQTCTTTFDPAPLLRNLGSAWGVDDLHEVVDLHYSARLTHNFGHCIPAHGRITIARRLLDYIDVLEEVVVHEVAHLEVWRRHAAEARAHGPEWAALMDLAGYQPRRSLPPLPGDPPIRTRTPRYYLHRCPVCSAQRVGRRPVTWWRCVSCHNAGRDGLLHITRLDEVSGGAR